MTDLTATELEWREWIERACASVDVDPDLVDVEAIHGLTKDIAHEAVRAMAPVGAFILGVAVGRGGAVQDSDSLLAALRSSWRDADHG